MLYDDCCVEVRFYLRCKDVQLKKNLEGENAHRIIV